MATDNPFPHRWAYCDATCSTCGSVDRVTVCYCESSYTCYNCKGKNK